MFRFFAINKNDELSIDDIHHLKNVARITIGEHFELVSTNNNVFECELTSVNPFGYKKIKELKSQNELGIDVSLIFALSKGDKNDFVIQKATELGATRIILCPSERSVVKFDDKQINKKLDRFKAIAKEASMQSHRNAIPDVILLSKFKDIFKYNSSLNLVAYEKSDSGYIKTFDNIKSADSINIYIGSEGGISLKEFDLLSNNGYKTVSLGKRILRAETAAVYALSVISYLIEK